jgi:excinuclease ABC subunit C
VGEKTEQRLLLHYGSVARIAAAPLEELSALVGANLAIEIHEYLNND